LQKESAASDDSLFKAFENIVKANSHGDTANDFDSFAHLFSFRFCALADLNISCDSLRIVKKTYAASGKRDADIKTFAD
jgi:hypothetical protein